MWEDGSHSTDIYDESAVLTTSPVSGPAIIRASHTTYVIPPGWSYQSDEYGNGVMTRTATNGQ
jgi:N-methylhydantoinase A/acetophenone carboxylase